MFCCLRELMCGGHECGCRRNCGGMRPVPCHREEREERHHRVCRCEVRCRWEERRREEKREERRCHCPCCRHGGRREEGEREHGHGECGCGRGEREERREKHGEWHTHCCFEHTCECGRRM